MMAKTISAKDIEEEVKEAFRVFDRVTYFNKSHLFSRNSLIM